MNKYEEALFFYCRNNYIIINDLLWGNGDKLEKGIELIVDDAKGVMKEADEVGIENRWKALQEECQVVYDAYKRRTPHILDEKGKKQLLNQAIEDIDCLYKMMKPCEQNIILYRNVRASNFQNHLPGDKIKMKGFSSCSRGKLEEGFGKEKFFRLKVLAPKETICIDTTFYPKYANEEGEVILPPLEGIVQSIVPNKNLNCICEIEVLLTKTFKPQITKKFFEEIKNK